MKKYLIFDLDWTLIQSNNYIDTLIYKYIWENIWEEYIDHAKYIIQNNQWMSIKEWFSILLEWNQELINKHSQEVTKQINNISWNVVFFPNVVEKIKELSKKYTLFISTWNSDEFALEVLSSVWIDKYFDKILWSSYILKSSQHIDELISYTWDLSLPEKSIFIWDGQRDKQIALSKNIDFIHIWTCWKEKHQIETVDNIDSMLKKLDN